MVVCVCHVCLCGLEGYDEAHCEEETACVWDRPVELVLSGPPVQEEARGREDAAYYHGWDAPFWETVDGVVAALVVSV